MSALRSIIITIISRVVCSSGSSFVQYFNWTTIAMAATAATAATAVAATALVVIDDDGQLMAVASVS